MSTVAAVDAHQYCSQLPPSLRNNRNGFCYSPPFQWAGEGFPSSAVRLRCGSPRRTCYHSHLRLQRSNILLAASRSCVAPIKNTRTSGDSGCRTSTLLRPLKLVMGRRPCVRGGGAGHCPRVLPSLVKLSSRHQINLRQLRSVVKPRLNLG